MKTKTLHKITLASIAVLSIVACKKVDPHEAIVGTWEVEHTYINGTELDGPGSMTFEDCSTPPCPGTSSEFTNNTTGEISWELSEDAKKLSIVDTVTGGGAWNGTFDVETLTEKRLTMSSPSILGELKVEFAKK